MSVEVFEIRKPGSEVASIKVRVDGVLIGSFSSLSAARQYVGNPANGLAVRTLPSGIAKTRLIASYGNSKSHSVFAVLDENGRHAFYILTGPNGFMNTGRLTAEKAREIAATSADDFDAHSSPPAAVID
ncbi:hypothetical protein [Pararhizobium antarcticum]|uniref:hypothetical protein n=1 Tax=Pararhizobium antarcticum TaxID=1798805 RepID=UPI000ACFB464|nr:hypothetical protein [Pararhizobium antarcticum]